MFEMNQSNENRQRLFSSQESSEPDDEFPRSLDRIGFLVAGIVHNLFGPLTAMLGTIEILKLKHPELVNEFERLDRLATRLKGDISVIMEKAHKEGVNDAQEINLLDLVQNELEFFKGDPRIKHEIEVKYHTPGSVPVFKAPYRNFSISIDHLITNAVESMADQNLKRLDVAISSKSNKLELCVKDNGCGMDREILSRAFEPFFTTKEPVFEGKYPPVRATGIGLTHTKELLSTLGCTIDLASEPGKGTSVTISIPYKTLNETYS